MGWRWWVNAYFRVLFSREIWFSWYFIILEFLMFLGLFQDENYVEWYDPLIKAVKCVFFLLLLAVVFTSGGCLQAWLHIRTKQRVERETAARMAYVQVMQSERLQASTQATSPIEEPKQSPWFLGAWADMLDQEAKKEK